MKSTTKQFLPLLFRGEVHAESENPFQRAVMYDVVSLAKIIFVSLVFASVYYVSVFAAAKRKSELKHEQYLRRIKKFW